MRLAVIPARGGSKRIPRKNIKPFGGLPMIAWSIAAAKLSGCFDRIIVSTDDIEIAQVAQSQGAEVPFMRPPELSDDHVSTIPVIAHSIRWQNANGLQATEVCCIYATAPFVQANDLQHGCRLMRETGADYVFSVTRYAYPIQRALRLTPGSRVKMWNPEHYQTRSQDLEEAFHDAGQFYWGQADAWLNQRPIFSSNAAPIILPHERVQDIDTPEDWREAEIKFLSLIKGTSSRS
jgi:N-acylneuraminate cytidylyltransferase